MVEEYLKNIKDTYEVYKVLGMYRPKGVHIGHRIYGFFSRLISVDMFFVLQTLMIFTRIDNIVDFADLLSMQLTWVSIALKSYIVINTFDNLDKVVAQLRELLEMCTKNNHSFGKHVRIRMKNVRRVFLIYWISCVTSVSMGFITAVIFTKEPPYIPHYRLYSPSFFDFEQNYVYFLITEVVELIGPILAASSAVAMDFLGPYFFSIGAGLLEELSERISLIETEFKLKIDSKDKKKTQQVLDELKRRHEEETVKEINVCIEIRLKIDEFIAEAQKYVSSIIFVQIMVSAVVICMTCYTISMFSPLNGGSIFFRQISYIIPIAMQVFTQCYYGNEIMLAAEKFSIDLFHSNWYHGCRMFQKNFKILMVHATKPLIMICGAMFQVTLENFVTVCEFTYKFYTLMKNQNAK